MKKILYLMTMAAALFVTSCDTYDEYYTDEYASVVRLSVFGETEFSIPASEAQTDIEFDVLRSGHDISRASTATVRVMTDEEWQKYAQTYGVQRYYKVPDDCFTIGEGSSIKLSYASKEFTKPVNVIVSSEKLGKYAASLPPPINEGKEWANVIVLPIVLVGDDCSVYDLQKNLIMLLDYDKNK